MVFANRSSRRLQPCSRRMSPNHAILDYDTLSTGVRRFFKKLRATVQREIGKAVRDADAKRKLAIARCRLGRWLRSAASISNSNSTLVSSWRKDVALKYSVSNVACPRRMSLMGQIRP